MALVSVHDYERKSGELLAKSSYDYYQSGAGDEFSLRLNRTAFDCLRIRPRVLVDVSQRSTKCNVLGFDLDLPIAIAPTAMHKMAHFEGEHATAKAAFTVNTIYTMSPLSTSSIEDVAKSAPNTNKWFQLHIYKNREITKELVRRVETEGYKAIVLTVDVPIWSSRRADIRNKFQLAEHLSFDNFVNFKEFSKKSEDDLGIGERMSKQYDDTHNWNDVQWLVNITRLPVILKGIMTREDAELAVNSGCKGIIVSNHGARQLDSVSAPIEVLPEIVDTVGTRLIVMLDGGIRNGTDVFKAIALGAKLVFIGRPVIYGLAVNGQKGVEEIFNILKRELDATMALSGVSRIERISREYVAVDSFHRHPKL